jgi:peptidylprolyl isomerase
MKKTGLGLALIALGLFACSGQQAVKTTTSTTQAPMDKMDSGFKMIDQKVGTGAEAVAGKTVSVHYTGTLQSDGSKFDSSLDHGSPFTFHLGAGEVIKGWDEGVAGMKVGGKRQLICPPAYAYGVAGHPPVIPRNSTLVFDVELLEVK